MIARLFSQAAPSIASAAVVVAAFSVMSRLAGLVRDRVLVGLYGTGDALDVYYQAFKVPDFLLQLFVVGALSASFIPVFSRYFSKGDHERAWRYTSAMLSLLLLSFGLLVAFGWLYADHLALIVAPGFSAEKREVLADMMRVIFLGQWFFSASLVFGSVLQGAKRFVLYSFAPILNNFGIILGAVFLTPVFGVMGLAWGAVLGAFLHALIQVVGATSLGYRFRPVGFWRDNDVVQTVSQMGPRMLGLAVGQVNFLIMSIAATSLAAGSIAKLNFAYTLNYLPIGVIAVSYAIAAFPTFCEKATARSGEGFVASFSDTMRQMLFFIIPATVLFLLLRAQIVRVVFGAEGFSWADTISTADALGFFAISFFAQAAVFVLVRAYFAFEDAVTPLAVGAVSAVVNALGAWLLLERMGVAGLGLAFSLAAIFQAALLWVFLRIRLGSLDELRIVRSLAIMSLAALAMGVAMQSAKYTFVQLWQLTTFWGVFAQAAVATVIGCTAYAITASALRSSEMSVFWQGMRRKFLRAARPNEVTEVVS